MYGEWLREQFDKGAIPEPTYDPYYLHFLDYGLFDEDGVINEHGVHFDFHLAGMGISIFINEVSYCVDNVEKQQDSENEGYDFQKILDSVVFDVHSV
jgi:hypothetical protein